MLIADRPPRPGGGALLARRGGGPAPCRLPSNGIASAALDPMRSLALLLIPMLCGVAFAQPLPIPRDGLHSCPAGYSRSGASCVPVSDRSQAAIPKASGSVCPVGWKSSGNACLKL